MQPSADRKYNITTTNKKKQTRENCAKCKQNQTNQIKLTLNNNRVNKKKISQLVKQSWHAYV